MQNSSKVVEADSPENDGQGNTSRFPYVGPAMWANFSVSKTWDGRPIDHEPVFIGITPNNAFLVIEIDAPHFQDPAPPNGVRGKPYKKLWEHEVVEMFFLGQDEKYLELEFNPHGQYLVLLLNGRKNVIRECLPMYYMSTVGGGRWQALTKVPKAYFPPNVNMLNAYAIHGTGENRVYEAMYPAPADHFDSPDFHRLEYFKSYNFSDCRLTNNPLSQVWRDALEAAREQEGELACSPD